MYWPNIATGCSAFGPIFRDRYRKTLHIFFFKSFKFLKKIVYPTYLRNSCIREALNPSKCADSSTNIRRRKRREKRRRIIKVFACHVTGVTCCVSPVTCH